VSVSRPVTAAAQRNREREMGQDIREVVLKLRLAFDGEKVLLNRVQEVSTDMRGVANCAF
jgi:hypothetical protein